VSAGSKAHTFKEGLLCYVDQLLSLGTYRAAGEGSCTISMESLVVSAYVNTDDVTTDKVEATVPSAADMGMKIPSDALVLNGHSYYLYDNS
jgi:hypothetical protein